MQEFEDYVKSNWNVPGATSCGITYTHTVRTVVGKQNKPSVKNHSLNLTIAWRDKDNVQLMTEKLSFLNDDMTKAYDKKLTTISRKELVNKFRTAKQAIITKILNEKHEKLLSIQHDIAELRAYMGRSDDIIPPSMKGVCIDLVHQTVQEGASTQSKQNFDM